MTAQRFPVRFHVNGSEARVWAAPNQTLLQVLRDEVGTTDVKYGCGEGVCGTCTVLLDGEPSNACLMFAVEAEGREITTARGLLGAGLDLHPLQSAFLESGAAQCGFCTPGMLLTAQWLLEETPSPTRGEIRAALAGNLCRCTGYTKIVDAVERCALVKVEGTPGAHDRTARMRIGGGPAGREVIPNDFADKVRGSLAYAADWTLPGMLYGKVVRSQRPCARIVSIDSSEARALPGVAAILTAEDVPHNSMSEAAIGFGQGTIETPVLATERVRYAGEPIALVAASDAAIAEEAADRIRVSYEELPGVFDPEEALERGAPHVHDQGNLLAHWKFEQGEVAGALRSADVVVEGVYRSHPVDHAYLEPEAGVGWVDSDGVVTLRVSTQVTEHSRLIAHVLGLPQSRVRVMATYMGGGFGGKEDMTVEPHLALLVALTGRPVKMVWARQESLLARPKRHPFVMRYRTGAASEGRIVAQEISLVADCGAYPYLSPRVTFAAAVTAAGPYRTASARIEVSAVFTNNVPNSAFRGFGAMQMTFGYEAQMDKLANALGLDRADVRERNYLRQGDALPTGETLDTVVGSKEACRAALERLGDPLATGVSRKRRGRGLASNIQPYGRAVFFHDQASCWISLEPDGALVIRAGVTDLGGGQAASLAQIAGEVLGVPLDRIAVHIGDTALTPLTGGTFATRQLYMSGNAALKTARELRDRLASVAAKLLETDPEAVVFADGVVGGSAPGDGSLTFSELVEACTREGVSPAHLGTFVAERGEFDPAKGEGRTFPDYTYGTHAVDVEVDVETGVVTVLKYVACHDVGRAIDVQRVEGQIQGGAAQGIGYALSEELVLDGGISRSGLFADYLIPCTLDLPDIEAVVLEIGEGKGPFGARGIGEPPIGPPAAALASAIEDAIGVRIAELPLTPERVLEAIRGASSRIDASGPVAASAA